MSASVTRALTWECWSVGDVVKDEGIMLLLDERVGLGICQD